MIPDRKYADVMVRIFFELNVSTLANKVTNGIIKKYKMYATIKMNIFYFKSANKKCFKIMYMKKIPKYENNCSGLAYN